jgi:hypothetical protein
MHFSDDTRNNYEAASVGAHRREACRFSDLFLARVDGTIALPLTRIVRQNDIATFSTLRFIAAVGSLSERRDGSG